jgi:MFS family permease
LLIPFVNILHGGALVLGLLLTVRGLGGLLGGFITVRVSNLLSPILIFPLGLCAVGLLDLIMFNIPILSIVLACLFLIGIPAMGTGVSSLTLLQTSVADQFRGRIFGIWGTTVSLVTIFGQVWGSTLGDRVGIIPMLNVAGILYVLSGLVAFLMMARIAPNKVVAKTTQV